MGLMMIPNQPAHQCHQCCRRRRRRHASLPFKIVTTLGTNLSTIVSQPLNDDMSKVRVEALDRLEISEEEEH